jgi:epsilon-lactone hydrolase
VNMADRLGREVARMLTRRLMRWVLDPESTWDQRRRRQRVTAAIPAAANVAVTQISLGAMAAELHQPQHPRSDLAVLYLHGGAYVLGCARAYRHLVSRLSRALRAAVWVPDYRLAPEHPFPAALDDAVEAYTAMVESGHPRIVIAGDSAGGGLALALADELARRGLPAPLALALICPWVDLTFDGSRQRQESSRDPVLSRWFLEAGARAYADGSTRADPRISPLLADLSRLPPVVVDVCSDDPLAIDGRRLVRRIEAAGGVVNSYEYTDTWHVFHLLAGVLPAADTAICVLASRIDQLVQRAESQTQ